MMKTPQSRIRYNVYRMKSSDIANEANWKLLSEISRHAVMKTKTGKAWNKAFTLMR